ncbi:MAG: AAA family ATPase, partial [Candidatus Portnoybacteria bacterium]|nr:AAA family ATPase [Candidatus Portnoybacteria bacterium]
LPKGLNKKNFGKLSVRRNQIIADIFSKTPYVEQIGSGIKRMRMLAKRANLPLPKFEVNSFFIVTFKRRKLLKKPLSEGVSERVSEGVNSLFNYIKNNPKRRVPHFEEDLGIPAKTIERWLNKLKKDGKIEFKGSPKTGGYWEVKD